MGSLPRGGESGRSWTRIEPWTMQDGQPARTGKTPPNGAISPGVNTVPAIRPCPGHPLILSARNWSSLIILKCLAFPLVSGKPFSTAAAATMASPACRPLDGPYSSM